MTKKLTTLGRSTALNEHIPRSKQNMPLPYNFVLSTLDFRLIFFNPMKVVLRYLLELQCTYKCRKTGEPSLSQKKVIIFFQKAVSLEINAQM